LFNDILAADNIEKWPDRPSFADFTSTNGAANSARDGYEGAVRLKAMSYPDARPAPARRPRRRR